MGMHGFMETCKSKDDTCEAFDFKCRIESCVLELPGKVTV